MLRSQTALASLLGSLLVVPTFLGQGRITTLQDALAGTTRALDVLRGIEQRLQEEPAAGLGLLFSATEAPLGDEAQRDERLEVLRGEVNLLQMELDARESPLGASDGAVAGALGSREPLPAPRTGPSAPAAGAPAAGISTGLDDGLRALLTEAPAPRTPTRSAASPRPGERGAGAAASAEGGAYSADPLRHAIACYRAGRYAEAHELLATRDDAAALYWRARALERLERLDEAIATMERALAQGGEGFERPRAETDLEFLRWKRDFLSALPVAGGAVRETRGSSRP